MLNIKCKGKYNSNCVILKVKKCQNYYAFSFIIDIFFCKYQKLNTYNTY